MQNVLRKGDIYRHPFLRFREPHNTGCRHKMFREGPVKHDFVDFRPIWAELCQGSKHDQFADNQFPIVLKQLYYD